MMLRLTVLAATAAASLVLGTTATAASEDQRPCVSRVEYWSANTAPDTRPGIEDRWEVAGLGTDLDLALYLPWANGPAYEAVAYPRCAYSFDQAWYGVLYKTPATGPAAGHQVPLLILQWHQLGATPHGHLRVATAPRSDVTSP